MDVFHFANSWPIRTEASWILFLLLVHLSNSKTWKPRFSLVHWIHQSYLIILEIRHFSNSRSRWRKIKYAYRSIFTEFRRHSRRRTRTWRRSKTAWRSSRPITARTAAIWYKLLDFNRKMFKSEYSSKFKSSSQARFVPPGYDWFNIGIHFVMYRTVCYIPYVTYDMLWLAAVTPWKNYFDPLKLIWVNPSKISSGPKFNLIHLHRDWKTHWSNCQVFVRILVRNWIKLTFSVTLKIDQIDL